MAAGSINYYAEEPEKKWHPLTTVHAGGPQWRWPKCECLTSPGPFERKEGLFVNNDHYWSNREYYFPGNEAVIKVLVDL